MSGKVDKKLRKELKQLEQKQKEEFRSIIDTSRQVFEEEIAAYINSTPFWQRLAFAWLVLKGKVGRSKIAEARDVG